MKADVKRLNVEFTDHFQYDTLTLVASYKALVASYKVFNIGPFSENVCSFHSLSGYYVTVSAFVPRAQYLCAQL